MAPRLPKHIRRHNGRFRAVISVAGQRKAGPTFDTPEDAAAWLEQHRPVLEAPRVYTLQDAYDLLLADLEFKNRRKWTFRHHEYNWRTLTGELGWSADCPLHVVTQDQIRRYVIKRRRAGVADSTIFQKELATLNRLFRLAMRKGAGRLPIATSNPMDGLEKPAIHHERFGFIPRATVLSLVEAIRNWRSKPALRTNERDADLVEFLFRTGIRRHEAGAIRVQDVEMENRRIYIVQPKRAPRYAPISRALAPVVSRQLLRGGGPGGKLWGSWRMIQRCCANWQERLAEPRLTPHVLRHSFATDRANAGVTRFDLMTLMGHRSVGEVEKYYHATPSGLLAAVDLEAPPCHQATESESA